MNNKEVSNATCRRFAISTPNIIIKILMQVWLALSKQVSKVESLRKLTWMHYLYTNFRKKNLEVDKLNFYQNQQCTWVWYHPHILFLHYVLKDLCNKKSKYALPTFCLFLFPHKGMNQSKFEFIIRNRSCTSERSS